MIRGDDRQPAGGRLVNHHPEPILQRWQHKHRTLLIKRRQLGLAHKTHVPVCARIRRKKCARLRILVAHQQQLAVWQPQLGKSRQQICHSFLQAEPAGIYDPENRVVLRAGHKALRVKPQMHTHQFVRRYARCQHCALHKLRWNHHIIGGGILRHMLGMQPQVRARIAQPMALKFIHKQLVVVCRVRRRALHNCKRAVQLGGFHGMQPVVIEKMKHVRVMHVGAREQVKEIVCQVVGDRLCRRTRQQLHSARKIARQPQLHHARTVDTRLNPRID